MGCLFSLPENGYPVEDETKKANFYDSLSTASGIDDIRDKETGGEPESEHLTTELATEGMDADVSERLLSHDDQWCRFADADHETNAEARDWTNQPLAMSLRDAEQTMFGNRCLVTFSGKAFGIPFQLHMHWQRSPSSFEEVPLADDIQAASLPEPILAAVLACLREHMEMCQRIANRWDPSSELSLLCRKAHPGKAVRVSPQLFALLEEADRLYHATGGRYDPTCGAIWRIFRDKLRKGTIQSPLDEKHVSWEKVGWSERVRLHASGEGGMPAVQLSSRGMILDLDGLLKGWVIDQMNHCLQERFGNGTGKPLEETLRNFAVRAADTNKLPDRCPESTSVIADQMEANIQRYRLVGTFLDWGSEIRAWGMHPNGRPWRTMIIRPPVLEQLFAGWQQRGTPWHPGPQDAAYSLSFERSNEAFGLATSGDYFQIERFGFFHIVSPVEKRIRRATNDSVASVTVLARNATTADAFATAAMTFPNASEAAQWLQQQQPQVLAYCVLTRSVYKKDATAAIAGVFASPPFESLPTCFPLVRKLGDAARPSELDGNEPALAIAAKLETTFASCSTAASLIPRPIFLLSPASAESGQQGRGWVALIDTLAVCSLSPPRITFHVVGCSDPLLDGCQSKAAASSSSTQGTSAINPPSIFHLYLLTRSQQAQAEQFLHLARSQGDTRGCGALIPAAGFPQGADAPYAAPMLQISIEDRHRLAPDTDEYLVVANVHQILPGPQDSLRLLVFMRNQLGSISVQMPIEAFRTERPVLAESLRLFASSLPKAVVVLTLQLDNRLIHWSALTSLRWSAYHESAWLTCNIQKDSTLAQGLRQAMRRDSKDPVSSIDANPVLVGIQVLHGRSNLFAESSSKADPCAMFDTEFRTMTSDEDNAASTPANNRGPAWQANLLPKRVVSVRTRPQDAIAVLAAQVRSLISCGDHEILIMRPCAAFVDESRLNLGVLIRCKAKYRALRVGLSILGDKAGTPPTPVVKREETDTLEATKPTFDDSRNPSMAVQAEIG
jgi:thiamine biosynthesis lipoprotein